MKRGTHSGKQLSVRYNPEIVHPRVQWLMSRMQADDPWRDARDLSASEVIRMCVMLGLSVLEAKYRKHAEAAE